MIHIMATLAHHNDTHRELNGQTDHALDCHLICDKLII